VALPKNQFGERRVARMNQSRKAFADWFAVLMAYFVFATLAGKFRKNG
jgi:hypothetical protein